MTLYEAPLGTCDLHEGEHKFDEKTCHAWRSPTRRWVVYAIPYYGRQHHAREYEEGRREAAPHSICGSQPVRWVSGRGSEVRPRRAVCVKCDAELERLRAIHGPDFLVYPAGMVPEARP